jgi:hypothetical protein
MLCSICQGSIESCVLIEEADGDRIFTADHHGDVESLRSAIRDHCHIYNALDRYLKDHDFNLNSVEEGNSLTV